MYELYTRAGLSGLLCEDEKKGVSVVVAAAARRDAFVYKILYTRGKERARVGQRMAREWGTNEGARGGEGTGKAAAGRLHASNTPTILPLSDTGACVHYTHLHIYVDGFIPVWDLCRAAI